MSEVFLGGKVELHAADCMEWIRTVPDNTFDSCVTDPPYALVSIVKRFGKDGVAPVKKNAAFKRASAGFMGKRWDTGDVAHNPEFWAEVLRVLKPGAHLVAFAGTRTYHRLAVAIEDAGFEIRDMIAWTYGSGFPKSHDVSKGIDRSLGVERKVVSKGAPVKRMIPGADQNKSGWEKTDGREFVPTVTKAGSDEAAAWEGWGTALKPACEPICLARKPLSEKSIAANVLRWGTGALNVDGCRVPSEGGTAREGEASQVRRYTEKGSTNFAALPGSRGGDPEGRWPANLIHDGSDEVLSLFPSEAGAFAPVRGTEPSNAVTNVYGVRERTATVHHGDSGSAARFFYTAKADADDRLGSKHPTVKPVDLMQYLSRLVTPRGGLILEPFAGTGTTAEAAIREGFRCVLVERESEYQNCIRRRMRLILSGPEERARESIKAAGKLDLDAGPLFTQAVDSVTS